MNVKKIITLSVVPFATILGVFFRFAFLATKPGWELDEVVYTKITENFVATGTIWLKAGVPYYSHPPFYFEFMRWLFINFGAGITTGRYFAAVSQVIAIGLLFVTVNMIAGKKAGMIAAVMAILDGWLIFTGRIGWMENFQSILIVFSVLTFYATRKWKPEISGLVTGLVIGITVVFKHIAVFLFLFVILAWLFKGRKDTKRFTYMLSPAVAVLVIYLSIMLIGPHGTAFFNQTLSQVKRTLGFKFSPGLNYGMGTAIQAIVSRYWIFFTDLVLLGPGSIYIAVKSVRAIFGRNGNEDTTLLAWAASGLLFMGVIALKNPHYLVLILFPIIAVVTVSLSKLTDKVVTGILLIFILLSTGTWILRYTTPHDHLLQDVQTYAATNIPVDASVFTTQPVCAVIQQVSCVQFEGISTQAAQEAAADQAQWILAYTSTTQQFAPIDPATNQLVATFLGFKDKVQVYKNLKVVSP